MAENTLSATRSKAAVANVVAANGSPAHPVRGIGDAFFEGQLLDADTHF